MWVIQVRGNNIRDNKLSDRRITQTRTRISPKHFESNRDEYKIGNENKIEWINLLMHLIFAKPNNYLYLTYDQRD